MDLPEPGTKRQLTERIGQKGDRRFCIRWVELDNNYQWQKYPNSEIKLNWNIVVNNFRKTIKTYSSPILMHWQAKPRGFRRWGLYDVNDDEYYSREYYQIRFNTAVKQELIQANDNAIKENPVAVILMETTINVKEDGDIELNATE